MAGIGRNQGFAIASNLLKSLTRPASGGTASTSSYISGVVNSEVVSSHTAKWMQRLKVAGIGRNQGFAIASNLLKSLTRPASGGTASTSSYISGVVNSEVVSSHTAKWMQDTSKKSPMELINEVPPIKVEGRIAACEGDTNPALGHPIEFICLDREEPAVCKYCGLRYVQDHGHSHH